jgi:hypothetical protein
MDWFKSTGTVGGGLLLFVDLESSLSVSTGTDGGGLLLFVDLGSSLSAEFAGTLLLSAIGVSLISNEVLRGFPSIIFVHMGSISILPLLSVLQLGTLFSTTGVPSTLAFLPVETCGGLLPSVEVATSLFASVETDGSVLLSIESVGSLLSSGSLVLGLGGGLLVLVEPGCKLLFRMEGMEGREDT